MKVFGLILAIVCIAVAQGQVTVTPEHATLGKDDSDIRIGCNITNLSSYTLKWWRGDAEVDTKGGKFIAYDNNTLEIRDARVADSGIYLCVAAVDTQLSYNASVFVKAATHVKPFDRSKNLVQDDPLSVDCLTEGYPDPTITWTKVGEELNFADPRISTQELEGVANGTLKIMGLTMEDAGDFVCTAMNGLGSSNATVTVRVKDKLAALWPFLGICAEVIILCVIIFIYERRRAKKMEEEEEREESGQLTNSHDHKGKDEIRQRK